MLRASSLGLCLRSVFRGHQPCLLIRKTRAVSNNPVHLVHAPVIYAGLGTLSSLAPPLVIAGESGSEAGMDNPKGTRSSFTQTPSECVPRTPHVAEVARDIDGDSTLRFDVPRLPILSPSSLFRAGHRRRKRSFVHRPKQFLAQSPRFWKPNEQSHGEQLNVYQPVARNRRRYADPPTDLYITHDHRCAGRPWRAIPIRPFRSPVRPNFLPSVSIDLQEFRDSLLDVIANTSSADEAWVAYSNLLQLELPRSAHGHPHIPFAHLHRLFRLMATSRPKTRGSFLRLLSIATGIRESGGTLQLHEWNAIIDAAGKGWRKTQIGDFENALSIYKDMISGRTPGMTFSSAHGTNRRTVEQEDADAQTIPDIFTYTALINVAAQTRDVRALKRATSLLAASGLRPNRVTHLALLKYFTETGQLSGVRSTLIRMQDQRCELGLDGLNTCIWAYGRNNRVDLALLIYRILRANMKLELHVRDDPEYLVRGMQQLRDEEYIDVPPHMTPNEVTFTMMVQIMAYHGDLRTALRVFMDMLVAENVERGAPLVVDAHGYLRPVTYSPTLPVFRALFLGFSRFGIHHWGKVPPELEDANPPRGPRWILDNLNAMFDMFLELPSDTPVSSNTVYWILVAYRRTTLNNASVMRGVLKRLKGRFGDHMGWDGRLERWKKELSYDQESLDI